MAHIEQLDFFAKCFHAFPEIFRTKTSKVIDIGSLDINGGPHRLLECDYLGCDIGPGPNVDLVCPSQELSFDSSTFDAAISSECFEHNAFWRESLGQMARLTRSGGVVIWSAAGIGRAEHGTSRSKDDGISAPFVATSNDYYRNLDAQTASSAINHQGWYSHFAFFENSKANDLYFVGLRHGSTHAQKSAMSQLIANLTDKHGDVTKFRLRRLGYKLGLINIVERYFNLRRFIVVVLTADQKLARTKKRLFGSVS